MSAVGYLFLMRYPLNWSQSLFGYYVGFLLTIRGINLLVLIPLLKVRFQIRDTTLFFLGILSFATSEFLFAFVRATWQVFTGEYWYIYILFTAAGSPFCKNVSVLIYLYYSVFNIFKVYHAMRELQLEI